MPGANGVVGPRRRVFAEEMAEAMALILVGVWVGGGFDLGGREARLDAGTRVSGSWSERARSRGQSGARAVKRPSSRIGLDCVGGGFRVTNCRLVAQCRRREMMAGLGSARDGAVTPERDRRRC